MRGWAVCGRPFFVGSPSPSPSPSPPSLSRRQPRGFLSFCRQILSETPAVHSPENRKNRLCLYSVVIYRCTLAACTPCSGVIVLVGQILEVGSRQVHQEKCVNIDINRNGAAKENIHTCNYVYIVSFLLRATDLEYRYSDILTQLLLYRASVIQVPISDTLVHHRDLRLRRPSSSSPSSSCRFSPIKAVTCSSNPLPK